MNEAEPPTTLGMWTVEFGATTRRFEQPAAVLAYLSDVFDGYVDGRLVAREDVGARSWFAGSLLGMAPRVMQMHFALEWNGDVASLIFFDAATSEFRAKDTQQPIVADEEARRGIAHGELTPHPLEECMALSRAHRAIEEYMNTRARPAWLQYHPVA